MINDFLLTEDRVSMANGLEVRVPLLDQELVEFALALPSSFKVHHLEKKWALKKAVLPLLNEEILNKKKWGFSFNPYLLFDAQLKPLARKVLTREKVHEHGLFSWDWIERVLETPSSPRMRWHYFNLWVMVGFSQWHDLFFGEERRV
jgi:asparagine synthase (glutamine-hydrolysing)